MPQVQCARNHYYDTNEGACPHCRSEDAELGKTRAYYEPSPTMPMPTGTDSNKTVGIYSHIDAQVDPVVGWVVCTSGGDKGRDWRLVAGKNLIGRDAAMQVALTGDTTVSRERHAIISFEPRRKVFSLLPGDSRGLVYHNGDEVMAPVILAAHDRIELGKSTLVFLPFAGDSFGWDV